ncbi:MAG: DUF6174 domain-containing protein [Chloroflexota bacterium]|nr:DUF6174 domain-containing protein [Chloroflexota bacterium]
MQAAVGNSLRILIATTTALLLLVGALLWVADSQAASAADDVAAMRARWLAHPVPHYRMTVNRMGCFGPNCRIEVEVKDEKVISTVSNDCSWPAGSVTDLFDEVSRDHAIHYDPNRPIGSWCTRPYVIYDEQWGYPIWLGTGCSTNDHPTHSASQRTFFVEAFTPLP